MSCTSTKLESAKYLAAFKHNDKCYFLDGDEAIIGRNESSFIPVKDARISRSHCIVERTGSYTFTIRELNGHGTFVNDKKLKKNEVHELKHRDKVSLLGLEDYNFEFFINNKSKTPKAIFGKSHHLKEKMLNLDCSHFDEMNQINQQIHHMEVEKTGLRQELSTRLEDQENKFRKERLSLTNLETTTDKEKNLTERLLKEMEEKSRVEKEKLTQELNSKMDIITKKEEQFKQIKYELEQKYQREKEELEKRCNEEIQELKGRLAESELEQDRLQDETREVETKLEETKKILLENELEKFSLYQEKVAMEKKMETKLIDLRQENTSKDEAVKHLEQRLKEKEVEVEGIRKGVVGIEDNLQCSICSEIYLEPSVLNCGHMFCTICIDKWKKKKKICPMCRAKITSSVRLFGMDSVIEVHVQLLPKEARERRIQLIKEHKGGHSKTIPKKRKISHYQGIPPVIRPLNVLAAPFYPMLGRETHTVGAGQTVTPDMANANMFLLNNPQPALPPLVDLSNPSPNDTVDPFAWEPNGRLNGRASPRIARRRLNLPPTNAVHVAAIDLTTSTQVVPVPSTSSAQNDLIDLTSL